jgi:hypothetical protein
VALSLVLMSTAGFKGCPKTEKDRNVAFARDLVGAFEMVGPIIAKKKPSLEAKWNTATQSARKLVDAIDASNQTEIVTLLRDILPIVTEVVTAFKGDDKFEWAFALGQIALNFFVNHWLPQGAGVIASPDAEIVGSYLALPQFGCRLKPERCK